MALGPARGKGLICGGVCCRSGSRPVAGAAVGNKPAAGAAVGNKPVKGAAVGNKSVKGAAVGNKPVEGAGAEDPSSSMLIANSILSSCKHQA